MFLLWETLMSLLSGGEGGGGGDWHVNQNVGIQNSESIPRVIDIN